MARHVAYAAGWKKFEPLWDLAIRLKQVPAMLPTLGRVLTRFGAGRNGRSHVNGLYHDTGAKSLGPATMIEASVASLTGEYAQASTPTLTIRPR